MGNERIYLFMKTKIGNWLFTILVYLSSSLFDQTSAQQIKITPQPGKVFITSEMQDLEILNDSTLVSSILSDNQKSFYKVKNDTLFIKEGGTGISPDNKYIGFLRYKILTANSDTITLKRFKARETVSDSDKDALVFINLENLKQPLVGFKSIKLSFVSPFGYSGAAITVDSTRKVSYITFPEIKDENGRNLSLTTGYLSINEYSSFLDLLSKSMITKLPEVRGCNIDEGANKFEISETV
jgi:hypothetical protein